MPRRVSPTTPSGTSPTDTDLATRAHRLQRLAREREQSYQAKSLAQGLTTRRDELKGALHRVEALTKAREVLLLAGVPVSLNTAAFGRLVAHAADLHRRFVDDPASLTEPGAYQAAQVTRAVDAGQDSLLQAWQRHIRAAGPARLVDVLERFGRHNAAQELREVRDQLERLSVILPRDSSVLEQVAQLKAKGLAAIRASHLADDLDFLEQAMDQGVPLAALLEDRERFERLRQHGILAALRVVAS